MPDSRFDVVIIGAGIAGASVAWFLAQTHRVLILERESQPGYHATGRSGAIYVASYGNATVQALNRATWPFLSSPPTGFAEVPLVGPQCGVLTIDAHGDHDASTVDEPSSHRRLSALEAKAMVPILREDRLSGAWFDPDASAIDVDALLQGFLRGAKRSGAVLVTDREVRALCRERTEWRVTTNADDYFAPILVNAAGAWASTIANLAGASAIPLNPLKRTALIVDAPAGTNIAGWPLVLDARETFYFKPDAGRLLISPADETPSLPTDAYPDELAIALAIDRVQAIADLPVRRVVRSWAGLRTFAPDRTPVVGFDPVAQGFFWLAGQGGYGLQTSAAMGLLAASLIRKEPLPEALALVRENALAPERFA
jgi:D-arginine dehydrogenase